MRRLRLFAFLALLLVGCAREAQEPAPSAPALDVQNIADDFAAFFDATEGLSTEERVTAFKRDVAAQFPQFYGVERFGGRLTQEQQDARIAKAIEEFGAIREAFGERVRRFDVALDRNVTSFLTEFPDFVPDTDIWLLHSLGEMDGGTRTFGGRRHLIFGADGLVLYHPDGDEAAFFHHELFHVYHEPLIGGCEEIWCALWKEGLATYAAKTLNPEAGDAELLLEVPDNMARRTEENLAAAVGHLKGVLGSTDQDVYGGLFTGREDETGLPARRGYYLGYRVARELGKTHEIAALARLSAEEAKPLVLAAVDALAAEASGGEVRP